MSFLETIFAGVLNGTLTGFGSALGSYLGMQHLIEKLKPKERKK